MTHTHLANLTHYYYNNLTQNDEAIPSALALAMIAAVNQHIYDMLDDDEVDASEGFTPDELRLAREAADRLVALFTKTLTRVGGLK